MGFSDGYVLLEASDGTLRQVGLGTGTEGPRKTSSPRPACTPEYYLGGPLQVPRSRARTKIA